MCVLSVLFDLCTGAARALCVCVFVCLCVYVCVCVCVFAVGGNVQVELSDGINHFRGLEVNRVRLICLVSSVKTYN